MKKSIIFLKPTKKRHLSFFRWLDDNFDIGIGGREGGPFT